MAVSAQTGLEWPRVASARASVGARDVVMDTMRGVAILMVIGIHSLPEADGSALVTAIDAILRPCVPVFLFVSGYLTAKSGRVPLLKRLKRALEPYTIAFIAAYAFMAVNNPGMDHRPVVALARYGLAYVFVYYYVFVYIGCTVALWAVFAVAGEEHRQRLLVLLALAVVVGLTAGAYLDPLLSRLHVSDTVAEEVRMRDIPFWFSFMAAGTMVGLGRIETALRDLRYPIAAATVAAYAAYAAIRIVGLGDAADYDSVAFFLYAALFCIAMLGFGYRNAALATLGSASYFIYLWHIFPIMVLRPLPALQQHPVLSTVVVYAAALTVSVLLVWALRRAARPRLAQWLGV
jgi:surface polysaccharide O-acyltransferase-like enzyme